MPCTYYTDAEERQMSVDKIKDLQEALDKTTNLLCQICKNSNKLPEAIGLYEWWRDHQEMDKRRKAMEKMAKASEKGRLSALEQRRRDRIKVLESDVKELNSELKKLKGKK